MACKGVYKNKGAKLAAMAKILARLGGKAVVLEDGLENFEDELETLGWRGILGMNGFVEWTVVDIIDEVELNGDVITVSEDTIVSLGVAAVRATNSTKCWK